MKKYILCHRWLPHHLFRPPEVDRSQRDRKKQVVWLPIYLAFSLIVVDFIIFKSFVYAEDNLAAFQQEVIYAKQKQHAIMPNINDAALEREAQSLLIELEQKKEAGINASAQKTP